MSDPLITVQALGRACVLGQLFDATSGSLLHGFCLFKEKDIVPTKVDVSKSTVSYKEIRSIRDRAHSLNISASLEVSILGGMFAIGGMGSYLNSNSDTSESTTVACVAQYLTFTESLDVNSLRQLQAMTSAELARVRATHVVVSITYGGNVVGSLTQKSDESTSTTDVQGRFNLDVFKGMGSPFSVGAAADLSVEEKDKMDNYSLDVNLVADFSMAGEDAPTTAADMLSIFKKSGKLVGEGVPVEITLAELSIFQDGIPTVRELAEADLLEITEVYDRILVLGNNRAWLTREADAKRELFPAFLAKCRARKLEVTRLVQKARGELRIYLEAYRTLRTDTKRPSEFRQEVEKAFVDETALWEQDLVTWRDLVQRVRAAQIHGFPLISVSKLGATLNSSEKGYTAVILIPEIIGFANLLHTYRVLADDIRAWRLSLDKCASSHNSKSTPASGKTVFVSVYADNHLDAALLRLDDRTQSLANALEAARNKSKPVFLMYGPVLDNSLQLQWSVLGQEGWGILVDLSENWRYIGSVRRGKPHGFGVMTYADKTKYKGGWADGKRDGHGELLSVDGSVLESGIYTGNTLSWDGVVVTVTVYKDSIPVQHGEVTLRAGDSTRAQVEKIGKVMGWKIGQQFQLQVQFESELSPKTTNVRVNGSMIAAEEDPQAAFLSWQLDAVKKNVIKAYIV